MASKSTEHKPIQPRNDDEKVPMEKSPNIVDPFPFTFELNPSNLDETRKLYTQECPSLQITDKAKQVDLLQLLAWRIHSDYPLMLNIIDSYHRDNLQYFKNDHKNMT
eukprot:909634_1